MPLTKSIDSHIIDIKSIKLCHKNIIAKIHHLNMALNFYKKCGVNEPHLTFDFVNINIG